MNQQMSLLEARAVARAREHQLRPSPRGGTVRRSLALRGSAAVMSLASFRRRPVAREAGSRSAGVATVRG